MLVVFQDLFFSLPSLYPEPPRLNYNFPASLAPSTGSKSGQYNAGEATDFQAVLFTEEFALPFSVSLLPIGWIGEPMVLHFMPYITPSPHRVGVKTDRRNLSS